MEQTICLVGDVQPLLLPWTSYPLNSESHGIARGISVAIGNPPQFFAMTPTFVENNTFVVNEKECVNAQNYSCVAHNHGVYAPPTGVNRTSSSIRWNGTQGFDISSDQGFDFFYFNDDFALGDKNVPGVPFFTYNPRSGYSTFGSGLAIGPNSSFLETALTAQAIPNKAWSLWPGIPFADNGNDVDGLLILGGYDEARAAGDFTEFPLFDYGTLEVNVTGFEWQPFSGATIDLMPSNLTQILAYPQSYFEVITMPPSSFDKFYNATEGIMFQDYWVEWYDKPIGNLVITLSNGMKTMIPDDDLFYYPYEFDDQGVPNITSTSYHNGLIRPSVNYPDNMVLGVPYLSQHLLVADFDQGKWWMADAVKKDLGSTISKLKPLCTGGPTTNKVVPSPGSDSNSNPSKSNVAAIAGGVGGGVGALVLFVVAFFMYRRRKNKKQHKQTSEVQSSAQHEKQAMDYTQPGSMSPPPKYPTVFEAEQGWQQQTSPHVSTHSEVSPQRQSNPEYMPWNRSYDARNYELPGQDMPQSEVRHSTANSEPVEMPISPHPRQ